MLRGLPDDESFEYAVPQLIAECIYLQTFWLVSQAKQHGPHSVLYAWHNYKIVQPDSLFNNLGVLSWAFKIGVATDTSKLAAQNVQVPKIRTKRRALLGDPLKDGEFKFIRLDLPRAIHNASVVMDYTLPSISVFDPRRTVNGVRFWASKRHLLVAMRFTLAQYECPNASIAQRSLRFLQDQLSLAADFR